MNIPTMTSINRKACYLPALLLVTMIAAPTELNAAQRRGIVGQPAPNLAVSQWHNLPNGTSAVEISKLRGKVVYLFFFQSWCPGCHSHGFPTLKAMQKHFAANNDVSFLAVQTVFEGFFTNTTGKAKSTADDFGLTIPVGHDAGDGDSGSVTMRRYRSGGTPWTVIIGRDGVVRFNGFRIAPKQAIALVNELLQKRDS